MEAAHNNGIRSNNHLSNLRWATRASNEADKRTHGTMAVGERHGKARLTRVEADRIREAVSAGATHTAVAEQFEVSRATVSQIVQRRTWK
jgi:DNA invertase Pin-like site-specific DNA recombinase